MSKPKEKVNIPMCLACVLLCLTLVSISMTSGLYARYIARDEAGDSARVAQWDVAATGGKTTLSIDCSSTDFDDDYKITVSNNSEVAVRYGIAVKFTEKLPAGISLKLDGSKSPVVSDDGKTYTFSNVGNFASGNESKEHSLVLTAIPDDIDEDTKNSFTVTVNFEQID